MSTLHTTPSGHNAKITTFDLQSKFHQMQNSQRIFFATIEKDCAEIKDICTEVRKLCFRLLKGAPPGQEAVNHYISELSIVKGGNHKLDTKYRKHLAMIEVNLHSTFFISSENGLYELDIWKKASIC